jgi:hypothetical protein
MPEIVAAAMPQPTHHCLGTWARSREKTPVKCASFDFFDFRGNIKAPEFLLTSFWTDTIMVPFTDC